MSLYLFGLRYISHTKEGKSTDSSLSVVAASAFALACHQGLFLKQASNTLPLLPGSNFISYEIHHEGIEVSKKKSLFESLRKSKILPYLVFVDSRCMSNRDSFRR